MTRWSGHCLDGLCDRCTYAPCDHCEHEARETTETEVAA